MNSINRRTVLKAVLAVTATTIIASSAGFAKESTTEIRIGWQKGGTLSVAKARGLLEKTLVANGVEVKWLQFPAGPQMLEALNVGSIDLATTGDAPPVFAQAAGADLLYVANEPPSVHTETLLRPKDSPIKSVAELKGKRVALNKGSNVHYLLVRLLENAGLKYSDVNVVFLTPADARAAFERGAVDAWAIWDPYATAAEVQIGARRLADASGVADNRQFYLATRSFARKHPDVLKLALHEIDLTSKWIEQNLDDAVRIVAPQIGLPHEIVRRYLSKREIYGVTTPLTDEVIRRQQHVADVFYELKLIPKPLDVAAVVWRN